MQSAVETEFNASWWIGFRTQVFRYLLLLKRHWWVPLFTTSICLGAAAWYLSQLPPAFLSQGRMMVSGKINLPENGGTIYSEDLMNFYGTQIELMESELVQSRARARLQAINPDLNLNYPPGKIRLSVSQEPKTSLFIMQVMSPNGDFSQKYLDACMDEYINIKKEMRSEKSDTTVAALTGELARVDKDLQVHEDQLLQFQKENNLGYLQEEGNSAAVYLAQRKSEYANLKAEYQLLGLLNLDQNLDRAQATQSTQGDNVSTTSRLLQGFGPISDYLKARQDLQMLTLRREQLAQSMRPQHPDMIALDQAITQEKQLIESFRQQSMEELAGRREGIKLQMDNLDSIIKEWESKAADYSRRLAEYEIIKGKTDRIKAEYDRLFSSLRNVDITKSVDQDMVSILERASAPHSITPGLVKIIAMSLFGGLLLGFGVLFILDRIDDGISSFQHIQRHFKNTTLLGQLLHEPHDGPLELLRPNDLRHGFAESFRSLRSSLIFMPVEGERPKSFVVTSAIPGEGKSTTATNLAIAMALSGSKTLLIDSDLRRGAIHRAFGMSNEVGFSDVLQSQLSWRDAVRPTSIEHLDFIARGKSINHPGERLLSPVTDRILKETYQEYDFIIFDTPPVLVADDTTSLAPKVDAVLCVVRMGVSSARMTRRILEMLAQRQANVLGLVVNDVTGIVDDYGNYKYGKYYETSEV